jgi:hypothetical protein
MNGLIDYVVTAEETHENKQERRPLLLQVAAVSNKVYFILQDLAAVPKLSKQREPGPVVLQTADAEVAPIVDMNCMAKEPHGGLNGGLDGRTAGGAKELFPQVLQATSWCGTRVLRQDEMRGIVRPCLPRPQNYCRGEGWCSAEKAVLCE